MSKNFEKKIEELFLHKEKVIDSNILESIIKTSLLLREGRGEISEISDQEILKFLPKFEFTEDVGIAGEDARTDFQLFINKKLANKPTIQEKLKYLQQFSSEELIVSDTKELLTNLMLLKILINIFRKSSYGSAGMQFESFIAGLLGGTQIKRDIHRNVVDVYINNKNYQIKTKAENGSVSMSYQNLKNYFDGYVDKKEIKHPPHSILNFLVFEKVGSSGSDSSGITGIKCFSGTMNKNQFQTLTPSEEFIVPEDFYKQELGQIIITDEILNKYSLKLKDNIKTVLIEVANLVNNVNLFYIKNSSNAAKAGVQNAENIKQVLDKPKT